MAAITGFSTGHRGWSDRLADRSIAMMSHASERAANYAEIAGVILGSGELDPARSPRAVVNVDDYVQNEVQGRLACMQRTLVRRQAEMTRLQAMKVQVRMLQRLPRTIVSPERNIIIEVPQPPQIEVDTL